MFDKITAWMNRIMNRQTGCCQEKVCCSGGHEKQVEEWIVGFKETDAGKVPLVATQLTFKDQLGGCKARWGIKRMNYIIKPGLYGIGNPDSHAPVLVTANYKMTLDKLRKELDNLNCWILVLDTKGINVWCAAGKGTFGNEELIHRLDTVRLNRIVSHRYLILTQLGAPGIAGHFIKKTTGFKVLYGPIRARDLRQFIKEGYKASKEMREVTFTFKERLALVPMELIPAFKMIPFIMVFFMIVHLLKGQFSLLNWTNDLGFLIIAVFTGAFLFQIVLPWIPLRSFVLKGWILGFAGIIVSNTCFNITGYETLANLMIFPPLTAFIALNFTGSTVFISLSGVQKEILYGIPAMIGSAIGGLVIKIIL